MPHRALLGRIRAEFIEMPGLQLTVEQVQRLCGAERAACHAVLEELVETQFLRRDGDKVYARPTDEVSRARPAKADLRIGRVRSAS